MNRDSKRKVRNLSKRVHETGAKRSWSGPWVNHLYFSLSLLFLNHVLSNSWQLSWVYCLNGVLGGELERYADIHGRITIKVVVPSCQKNDDEDRNVSLFEDDKVLDLLLFFFFFRCRMDAVTYCPQPCQHIFYRKITQSLSFDPTVLMRNYSSLF